MGSDRYSWELVSEGNQTPAQLVAARARVAELEAENTALRAGLKAREETIARLTAKLRTDAADSAGERRDWDALEDLERRPSEPHIHKWSADQPGGPRCVECGWWLAWGDS